MIQLLRAYGWVGALAPLSLGLLGCGEEDSSTAFDTSEVTIAAGSPSSATTTSTAATTSNSSATSTTGGTPSSANDTASSSVDGSGGTSGNTSTTGSTTGSSNGWLETKDNKIVYADSGEAFRGRGANIHETRSCNACTWTDPNLNEVKRRIDALVDDWGANFMRLLLESYDTSEGRAHFASPAEDAAYLGEIVEIVDYIGTKPGVYVLVSLWIDPSFTAQGWPTAETTGVWEVVADALVDRPHVLFGLVNEPQSNFDGAQDAQVWEAMNDTVQGIRDVEEARGSRQHIIAVQGTRAWARDLEYYVDNPITAGGGTNIAYETHSYLKSSEFERVWAGPASSLPVIIGEFGPADLGDGTEMTIADTTTMMDLAEELDVPWLAWTFHMRCEPNLLVDNSGGGCGEGMELEPTEWGSHIKTRLSQPWGSP